MNNLKMFCLTMKNNHLNKIKQLNYIPVGLGEDIIAKDFLRDNIGENISKKNPFYGEYSFHYWLWKNNFNGIDDSWIGFCQYRKHWLKNSINYEILDLNQLNENILKNIPEKIENFETILGEPLYINKFRFSKFIKRNLGKMLINPILFLDKNKRNIKFHFDMMHGNGNLDKAINLLERDNRDDFKTLLTRKYLSILITCLYVKIKKF